MNELEKVLSELSASFTPVPPPLRITISKAPSFAVDLSKMVVLVPENWSQFSYLRELIGHEVKHASGDGLPYTYKQMLKHEAHVMKGLGVPLKTARTLLNVIYDAVADLRLAEEGLDVKGMCDEWLKWFSVTPESEGSCHHLLQIIYKDLFGAQLQETSYERMLRREEGFERLKMILKKLAASQEKDLQLIVEAAKLVASLSRVEEPPIGCDVDFDRSDPNVRADASEIGLDAQLNEQQLAELMGVGENELSKALEEAAEDKARAALWSKILGFKEFFASSSLLELKEPVLRRWKPHSRRIDPQSILKAPDDPRRWRELKVETIMVVEGEGESGGFSKLILLLDCSGSTASFYQGRSVLSYIKDAAYGLIAYAKHLELPVALVAFQSEARILSRESKNYVDVAKKVFLLRPGGSTNLEGAVLAASTLKPEKALLALLTDGFVDVDHLRRFAEQSKINRLLVAVVDNEKGIETVKTIGEHAQLFTVKPDSAGRTIVSSLRANRAYSLE